MNKFRLKAAAYFLLYLLLSPFCLILTLCFWLIGSVKREAGCHGTNIPVEAEPKRTVLIAGANGAKALHFCRIIGRAGHRVVLADSTKYRSSGVRFSKYVAKYYSLDIDTSRRETTDRYVEALVAIAVKEKIDWFIPVSRAVTLERNLLLADRLRNLKPKVACLTLDSADQGLLLNDKVRFMDECRRVGLRVPEYFRIEGIDDLVRLQQERVFRNRHFFLKPLIPQTVDRDNFSAIPDDEEEFQKYLCYYKDRIRPENPYFVNEFIRGREFISAVLSDHGNVITINMNPSSIILDFYEDIDHSQVRRWTEEFCKKTKLTGMVGFDFIEDEKSGLVYCIECNPRPHSSIVSFQYDSRLEASIRYVLDEQTDGNPPFDSPKAIRTPVVPRNSPPVYWLYHEVGKLMSLQHTIASFIGVFWNGKEAVYLTEDPLPFFILNTAQMLDLLAMFIWTGDPFHSPNHCLGTPY